MFPPPRNPGPRAPRRADRRQSRAAPPIIIQQDPYRNGYTAGGYGRPINQPVPFVYPIPIPHAGGKPNIVPDSRNAPMTSTGATLGSAYVYVDPATLNSASATYPGIFQYELPKVVASTREGWQWTSQSGALVSGLLAAVAAQLLTFFKQTQLEPSGWQNFMVAACYAALFFNVNATIGSFVLVDNLRDVGQEAALLDAQGWLEHMKRAATFGGNSSRLLVEYGVSHLWRFALVHWFLSFYLGILSLVASVLTYVMLVEPLATRGVMSIIVALTLIPTFLFICFRGVTQRRHMIEHTMGV